MTPEELAVVRAAMAYREKLLANPRALDVLDNANNPLTPALSEIARVTHALSVACPQCNRGGHICPGDGNPVPHGASDCGEHSEPELIWVERTWADVRAGDRVRMPGSDATAHVQSAVHLRWHVKPGTERYAPQPLEWIGVRVFLETGANGDAHQYEMDPAKPVEIEIDRETAESAALLHGGEDWWEVRAGLVAGRQEVRA